MSLPKKLLSDFDEVLKDRGYQSRSKGIRDALQDYIPENLYHDGFYPLELIFQLDLFPQLQLSFCYSPFLFYLERADKLPFKLFYALIILKYFTVYCLCKILCAYV